MKKETNLFTKFQLVGTPDLRLRMERLLVATEPHTYIYQRVGTPSAE
jgi:hypothetical protein